MLSRRSLTLASQISQATTDGQASNDSEDSCPTPRPQPLPPTASLATPILEASEGEEDTPTNKLHNSSVQNESCSGKDGEISSHKEVKRQSRGSLKNQDMSSDDEEVQFKSTNTGETSEVMAMSEQTAEVTAAADKTSEDTAVTEKLTEDIAVTEKLTEDIAVTEKLTEDIAVIEKLTEVTDVIEKVTDVTEKVTEVTAVTEKLAEVTAVTEKLAETTTVEDKTSEVTALMGKSSKSYISNTINIGGNVTGSLTKSDDPSMETTGPIPSFRTRKKLSFSALEKSLMIKENKKKKRSTSEVSPVVNSNPFINRSGTKSTSSSIMEDTGDSSQTSAPESLDQMSDWYVEEEFRIVSDDSVSKIAEAKRKSKGGVKLTRGGKSQSQSGKSVERRTSKAREENVPDRESSMSVKMQTAKSVGKRKSQIVPPNVGEESIETNSQNTSSTMRKKSLKRKSNNEGESFKAEVKTAKSVGKRKSQIQQAVSAKDAEENVDENSQKQGKTLKQKILKRKSIASVPSKTADQSNGKDKHTKGCEDLGEKQTKAKKRKSLAVKNRTMYEGNKSEKVEYSYDSDNSSVIIDEYEKEIEKELKSRKSRAHKPDYVSGKPSKSVADAVSGKPTKSVADDNVKLNKNVVKKRRTFVLGDDDSETKEPLERIQTDIKNTKASVSDTGGWSSRSKVTDTGDISTKKRGQKNKSLLEKKQGETSHDMDIENDGNSSEKVFDDDLNKKEGSVVKKPLKRIGRNSRKSCPQIRSIPTTHPSNDTEDNGVGKKMRKNGRKSYPSKSVPARQSKGMKDHIDEGSIMDTDCVTAADEDLPCEDVPVEEEPCEDLPDKDLSSDNLPDDNILEEQEQDIRKNRRPRRAVAAKRKPDKKTKGTGLLKQTLSKNKTKKGVTEKKKGMPEKQSNVLKTGKTEPKQVSTAKGKLRNEQVSENKPNNGSKSKSKILSKAKGRRKQKISIGYVEGDSLTCTPKISSNSLTLSKTAARTLQLDVSEEQEVDNLDINESVSNVQSSQKNKMSSRKNSLSNRKSKKQKGKKGENVASRENDDEKEVSAVIVSDPVPADNDIPMLSQSKQSNLRRSLLANTILSPQGSFTPFSATPGSEFTLTRREEMFRSGVSFRQLKVERSGKKSISQNRSKTSDIEDNDQDVAVDKDEDDDDQNLDADEDVQDEVDYGDENGNDFPQNEIDDDIRDAQESSPKQQSTSNRKQLARRKSGLSKGLLGATPKSSSSPANLTPCLVTPGRKSLSKARRVTISNQVTEAVYIVPSDTSSPDSPISSKASRRPSIPGGELTTYISMSSTPIHACERTTTETPEPFQKPEKCKIILPDPSPPDGVRRSQRTRVQTLEWYKNERVDYKYRKSGGFVIAGIIPSQEAKILEHEKKKRKNMQKAHKMKKKKKKAASPPRNLSMHTPIPSDMNLTVSDEIPVMNPDTEEEVYVECFASKDSGVFVGPSGKQPSPEDPFVMSRILDQKGFGTGMLLLRPLQEKTIQMVSRGTLIFLLAQGVITMTVHKASVIMEAGDSAFVPRGNTYSMKNLRSEEAKLSYTVLKETLDTSNMWTS
ncbi:centromere protein C-like [Mizuhopecten yessoensis]|uniref:centromere protein C-like n=1 Tax=Mizuhopecten yessoensis TaxID=6573 RepID=UPI000B45F5CC|nr:centromere protein C-like [Mizuhopecten yessoensis]